MEISNKLILKIVHIIFNDMISVKDFDSKLLKINKNLYKILIFITFDISQ